MQLSHTTAAMSAVFDDPNLIGAAGLVPAVALCDRIGLRELAQDWIWVGGLGKPNAGAKVMSLVSGMVAGADSIDEMDVMRHGQRVGRCRVSLRPLLASRAGVLMIRVRSGGGLGLGQLVTGEDADGAGDENDLLGKWAIADDFRSAMTDSMLCRHLHNIDYLDVLVMPMSV